MLSPQARHVLDHPWRFAGRVFAGFRANQGFLLAGAVAYNTLLSIVPMFALILALLWEATRHVLVWYFSTLSLVNLVYGSFAAAIILLLSLEAGAVILLLGAQVIAEYERIGQPSAPTLGLQTRPGGEIQSAQDGAPPRRD